MATYLEGVVRSAGLPWAQGDPDNTFVVRQGEETGGQGDGTWACGGRVGDRWRESCCTVGAEGCELNGGLFVQYQQKKAGNGGPIWGDFFSGKCVHDASKAPIVCWAWDGCLVLQSVTAPYYETLAPELLNEDSDMKGYAEVLAVALTYVSAMDRFQARRKRKMCDAQKRQATTQMIPGRFCALFPANSKKRVFLRWEGTWQWWSGLSRGRGDDLGWTKRLCWLGSAVRHIWHLGSRWVIIRNPGHGYSSVGSVERETFSWY